MLVPNIPASQYLNSLLNSSELNNIPYYHPKEFFQYSFDLKDNDLKMPEMNLRTDLEIEESR